MGNELLPYYNRELSFIRRLGAQFARDHPKIAGRLRLGEEGLSEDPHVERMIEAFAYLTARIRRKLDDEFPEITSSLLDVLYPHYLAPIPSMAIVQLDLDPGQNEATEGHTIPRHTMLETEPIQGEPCRFQTCYPVTLWPIEVSEASLRKPPFRAPDTPWTKKAAAVLRLSLACRARAVRFADLKLGSLRFFLKGQPQHVYRLYELIFNHTIGVASWPAIGRTIPIRSSWAQDLSAPGGVRARRGPLALSGALVPGLSAAVGILRLSAEVPLLRTRRPGQQDAGPHRQPAGDLHLSESGGSPIWSKTSRRIRSSWDVRPWSTCFRSAPSRSSSRTRSSNTG